MYPTTTEQLNTLVMAVQCVHSFFSTTTGANDHRQVFITVSNRKYAHVASLAYGSRAEVVWMIEVSVWRRLSAHVRQVRAFINTTLRMRRVSIIHCLYFLLCTSINELCPQRQFLAGSQRSAYLNVKRFIVLKYCTINAYPLISIVKSITRLE